MTITTAQIRGARGLLNWSQNDLAERTGISTTSIGAIESGTTTPRKNTIEAIQQTFENSGIEFVDAGVRYKPDNIKIIEGENCYLKLLDDVFLTLRDAKNKELLISFSNDKVSPKEVNDTYRHIRKAGVAMRQLVEEGNTYLMGNLEEYRYIPKEFFINRVMVIYGTKFAIMLADEKKVSIINDSTIADVQRNMFNFTWHNCQAPATTTATERF